MALYTTKRHLTDRGTAQGADASGQSSIQRFCQFLTTVMAPVTSSKNQLLRENHFPAGKVINVPMVACTVDKYTAAACMPGACNANARTAFAMTADATSADEFDVNAFAALETVHGAILTDSFTDDAVVANEISHAVFLTHEITATSITADLNTADAFGGDETMLALLLLMHLLSIHPQMLLHGYRRLCEMACRSSTRLSANE